MIWPITRLQEAIVEGLLSDATLVALTGDGVEDGQGSLHHIGVMLNEPGIKSRQPYVAVQVVSSDPLILGESHIQVEKAMVLLLVFDRDECRGTRIADRLHSMLIHLPGNCNGYFNFSNEHIRNMSTEFYGRMGREFDRVLDTYVDGVEMAMVWSPTPCEEEIEEPECEECSEDAGETIDCEYDS